MALFLQTFILTRFCEVSSYVSSLTCQKSGESYAHRISFGVFYPCSRCIDLIWCEKTLANVLCKPVGFITVSMVLVFVPLYLELL